MPIRIGMCCLLPSPALRSGVVAIAAVVRAIAACALLTGVLSVVFMPRMSRAQATGAVPHTTPHLLHGQVGTVTHAALSSHRRLTGEEHARIFVVSGESRRHAWRSTVELRTNIPGVLILEPRATERGATAWRVLNSAGELVPWSSERIVIAETIPAGRHVTSVVWVAPDGVSSPPPASVRVAPMP